MKLWFESSGVGPSMLFIHAAIADARMWDPQWPVFSTTHHVVRCDLRGFGHTGLEPGDFSQCQDVLAGLDHLGIGSVVVVGASIGGRVALELALLAPQRVRALVLVGAGLPAHNWSEAVQRFGEAEDEALERGDIEGAVDLNVSFWLDGPSSRSSPTTTTPRTGGPSKP